MDNLLRQISVFLLLFFHDLVPSAGQSGDRLAPDNAISDGQVLTSAGGYFSLGFFSPGNRTKNRYVGIWCSNIPDSEKAAVWVANREQPLTDSSGVLKITQDGDLRVLDGAGRIHWSSNSSQAGLGTNASVVLLDTGNLVVQAVTSADENISSNGGGILWQSFEHPTDTWLPNMKLELDVATGASTRLVSWRSPEDPSPGEFSHGIDPETHLQLKIWRGEETIQRSFMVKEQTMPNKRDRQYSTVVVTEVGRTGDKLFVLYTTTIGSPLGRFVLDHTGTRRMLLWIDKVRKWVEVFPDSQTPCIAYDRCGPNAFCEDVAAKGTGESTPMGFRCSCLEGFDPRVRRQWEAGNYRAGCARRDPTPQTVTSTSTCSATGTAPAAAFRTIRGVKLPDTFRLLENASDAQCEAACVGNCSCTAYSFSNNNIPKTSGTTCLLWDGELRDVWRLISESAIVPLFAFDLMFRVSASEWGQKRSSTRKKTAVVVALAAVGAAAIALLVGCIMMRSYLTRKGILPRDREQTGKNRTVMFNHGRVHDTLPTKDTNGDNTPQLPVDVDFSSLVIATNNFSSANILGEGGFGPVYKGILPQGQEVAIKKLSRCSGQGYDEFKNEVELIARLQHTNLVQLLGWCMHDGQKLLIYEYLPNKSLDMFLFDPDRNAELNWKKRFVIIEGIAHGLLYLHRYSRLRIIHRDLKTSNILLDGEMNPKISDFGLARIFQKDQKEANTNNVVGTYGYIPPEYAFDGLFSEKSDVFAFGVMVLEIVSGKRSTGFYEYNGAYNLLGYAWEHWKECTAMELLDKTLSADQPPEQEVVACIQIGLLCVQERALDRPNMSTVVSMLAADASADLPIPQEPAFSTGRGPDHNV